MSFECVSPGGDDLCFNGGVCATDGASCVCPPGWGHDYAFFQCAALESVPRANSKSSDANCALPDHAYLYCMIASVVVNSLCGLLALAHFTKARFAVRRILSLHFGFLFGASLMSIGLYVQNGLYEVTVVGMLIVMLAVDAMASTSNRSLLKPAYSLASEESWRRVQRQLLAAEAFTVCLAATLQLGMLATARSDKATFNAWACAYLYFVSFNLFTGCMSTLTAR